jgi:hypothetical protein
LSDIPPGFILSHGIEDDSGLLLLAADQPIMSDGLQRLNDRGIETVSIHEYDRNRLPGIGANANRRGVSASTATAPTHAPHAERLWDATEPLKGLVVRRPGKDIDPAREANIRRVTTETAARLSELAQMLSTAPDAVFGPLCELTQNLALLLLEDPDEMLGALLAVQNHRSLNDRIVHLTALSLAMSIEQDMPGNVSMEIAQAALMHDLSLLGSDSLFQDPTAILDDQQLKILFQHPLQSRELIKKLDVSQSVRLTITQVHEQLDGSGYPNHLVEARIHPFAKLINIADTFLRLIGAGPNRLPFSPHDALGVMLHAQSSKIFDPYMLRTLVNVVTLFPLGCDIELSDGNEGRVIRRPKSGYDKPTVRVKGSRPNQTHIVELETSEVTVVRPVASEGVPCYRITLAEMPMFTWHPSTV